MRFLEASRLRRVLRSRTGENSGSGPSSLFFLRCSRIPGPFSLVISMLWAACFAGVSVVTVRGAFGPVPSLRQGSSAVTLSAALGLFICSAVHANEHGWFYVMAIML